jgi:hypothetical protein
LIGVCHHLNSRTSLLAVRSPLILYLFLLLVSLRMLRVVYLICLPYSVLVMAILAV